MNAVERIDQYEVYRIVTDYEALHEGFRDRVDDLEVTRQEIDAAGNLLPGYAGKLLCSPPIKNLGLVSLGKMLKATGMALVLVIDDERFAPVKAQMSKRQRPMRTNVSIKPPHWLISKETASKMRALGVLKLSPRQRKLIAKRAARARWSKRVTA